MRTAEHLFWRMRRSVSLKSVPPPGQTAKAARSLELTRAITSLLRTAFK